MFENNVFSAHHFEVDKSRHTILIIDDDEADRMLYKTYLSRAGNGHFYIFHEAAAGREGLEMYKKIQPDCVLLDYMLPDMTGMEVLNTLAELSPVLPVVILTGQGNEEIAIDTIRRGAQDYMAKHLITSEALQRTIINTIGRASLLEQLERAKKEAEDGRSKAEAADRAKSEFLATMSHEIRTPMNGIIGMAELLSLTGLDAKQKKYAGSIRSSGELLLTLINDILDFSKIEAQEMTLESQPLELNRLMDDVMEMLAVRAQDNKVEMTLGWPQEENIPVICSDPVRLRQVLINIIGNAVKFTRGGRVDVGVQTIERNEDTIRLRFEIKDNGIGIPPDKIEAVFQKFTQVDSSTTRKYGGTGLGLAIAKKIVTIMGGGIGASSVQGEGSLFWFEVPFAVSGKLPMPRAEAANESLPDGALPKFTAHVLIVEDDRMGQRMAKSILRELGCSFDLAGDGREALETLEKNQGKYDLVLMDWQMPVMDGHEAIRRARKESWGQDLKIVALTANAIQGDREKCLKAGADDYMSKPVRVTDVARVLKKYLPAHIASAA